MVVHKCECCCFSTNIKRTYDNHMKSARHIKCSSENLDIKFHTCTVCSKKYQSRMGLWLHNQKCKQKPVTTVTNVTNDISSPDIVNSIMENFKKLQEQIASIAPSNITNNNITNNNITLNYLNTHCGNAMNIDQFIDSMKLVKDDFNEIDKNRFYYQGATKILKKYFAKLSLEERPMHRATPVTNRPDLYFVRDENSWKQECQSMINYQIKYIEEFENEDEQLAMTRFFEKFNDKLYDTYKELCTSDRKMERIHDKMAVSGYSQSRIDMLDELTSRNLLVLDPPDSTDSDHILLAT
jgi:hypothetical protein